MNILILTGKFGMGHLSAANALREQLDQDGHRADVVDLFEYALPQRASAMYRWFNVLVTYGGVFYNLYPDLTVNDSGDGRGDNLLEGLDRLLDEYRPDVVVSTNSICSAAVARYKEDGPSPFRTAPQGTDLRRDLREHPDLDRKIRHGPSVRGQRAPGAAGPGRPPGRRR